MKHIKITFACILGLLFSSIGLIGQNSSTSMDQETVEWVNNLYQQGVEVVTNDSVFISKEVYKLLEDDQYRIAFYQNQNNWQTTIQYLKDNEIKKAVWNMINHYAMNDYYKDKVVKSILTYDQVFKMEDVLVSSFYTYCYTDPEIGEIVDGKPVIKAPHLLENKLNSVKEIIHFMQKYKASTAE